MDPQVLFGLAAVLSALASLAWAVRRRPQEGEGGNDRLCAPGAGHSPGSLSGK